MTYEVSGLMVESAEEELEEAENEYSRLATVAHQLRLENQHLRDAIGTINCALDALNLRGL